jgi:hypothetical protein
VFVLGWKRALDQGSPGGRKIWCIVRTQSGADFERDFGLEIVHLRIAQLDLKRIGRGEEVEVDSLILSSARFPA